MPFGGYRDFADCVAKNKSKGNPEAYCGYIKHKVEGRLSETEAAYSTFLAYKLSNGITLSEAKGQWNKLSESQKTNLFDVDNVWNTHDYATDQMNQYFDMFDKERAEHPDFTVDQVWQIVADHLKAGIKETKPMTPNQGPVYPAEAGSPLIRHWPPSESGGGIATPWVPFDKPHVKLSEKFHWMVPFTFVKNGFHKLMKGEAITVGKSKNKVPYTEDELLRGARTLKGKPLYHNHLETIGQARAYLEGRRLDTAGNLESTFDPRTIPSLVRANILSMIESDDPVNGHVLDSEYESSSVEYVAEITRPTAIAMAEAGLIKGPSIGAVPRNQSTTQPEGIMFEDMSLITDPETPGDPDASIKLMEMVRTWLTPTVDLRTQRRANLIEQRRIVLMQRKRVGVEMRSRIEAQKSNILLELAKHP